MIKLITKSITVVLLMSAVASCSTTDYRVLKADEVQIAGHPYKTAKGCERKAPVGTFDAKCDIPVVGIRGFNADHSFGVSAGGNASGPSF